MDLREYLPVVTLVNPEWVGPFAKRRLSRMGSDPVQGF